MCVVKVENTSYKAESLYQWDKNQVLQIYGISVPDTFEVHIGNAIIDSAIICNATMDDEGVISVEIPNLLLEYPCGITVYVCLYENETFKTVYKIDIPIIKRYKPVDFVLDTTNRYNVVAELENIKDRISNITTNISSVIEDQIPNITTNINSVTENLDSIREGVDGTLYPTAGDAVNTQLRDIYGRLDDIIKSIPEPNNIIDTGWIDIKDGFDQFSDYFEVYTIHSVARYRKMGDLVTLQIDANILSQMKFLTTALKLIRLPTECRPSGRIYCTATVTPTANAEILTGTKFVHCYITDAYNPDVCLTLDDEDNPIDINNGDYFDSTMIKIYVSYYVN